MNSLDDLLDAAINGNKQAEDQLFSKLRARILNLVQYKLQRARKHPSEMTQDVEDLAEEIMLTMLQKYKTEAFQYGFMAWMNRIVWNKVGDYFRKEKRHFFSELDGENLEDDSEDSPEQILVRKELNETIHRALKKLNSTGKEIIKALLEGRIKNYVKERKQKGDREGNIFCQIHRCRKRFMKLLKEEGFEA